MKHLSQVFIQEIIVTWIAQQTDWDEYLAVYHLQRKDNLALLCQKWEGMEMQLP